MQKLPIGIQAFETMRTEDYLYVDKTAHIHKMVTEGKFYFMSRPRRFGKSLLVSTLRCLFQGRRELFTGLWIDQHGDWDWQPYPVISFNFNDISHDTTENLQIGLGQSLHLAARSFGGELSAPLLPERLTELIQLARRQTGRNVVILIDEYDKPMIDHLGKGEEALAIARANRDLLKGFLGVLKGDVSPLFRFVFITGVSRFSKVSIFSELNHLEDLSMMPTFSDVMGYTQSELESYFQPNLYDLSEKLKLSIAQTLAVVTEQYNGYRFARNDVTVYNPFSLLNAFKHGDLGNYWFVSGTPTFLVNLLKSRTYRLPSLERLEVSPHLFTAYDLDNLRPEALLFQTGYLTIKDVTDNIYTLGYPNQEVRVSFAQHLLSAQVEGMNGADESRFMRLSRYLRLEDVPSFMETITAIFASIPYQLQSKRDEAYYHTLFYLMVTASGVRAEIEAPSNLGRMDMAISLNDKIYIIEFKCNQSADAALSQIRERGYALRYRQSGQKLIMLGNNFSRRKRNVVEWKMEIE